MGKSPYTVIVETIVPIQLVTVFPLRIQETFFKLGILRQVYKAYIFGGPCILFLFGKLTIAEVSQSSNVWVTGYTYNDVNRGNDD